jgi:hypothetical protein
MTRAFRRSWSATIGNTRITHGAEGRELTVKFQVNKSTRREPNTASVKIANLRADRRRELEQADDPELELRAGYVDLEDIIFAGDALDIWSSRDGVDVWTNIEAKDGGRSYRTADFEASYDFNVSVSTVFRDLANAMGVGFGNAAAIIADAELDTSGLIWPEGIVLTGPAWRSMDRLCRSCSLRWSVQNGVLQMRTAGQPAETRAISLRAGTTLIGSPTRGKRDERSRKIAYGVRSLIIPGLYPGRVISIESREINGGFLCKRVKFIGDSAGNDWFADLELEEY